MRVMHVLLAVVLSMFLPAPLAAQTQITTASSKGWCRCERRGAARRDVEVRNVDTNLTRTLVDRSRRPLRRPAAAARPLHRHFTLSGFATLVQEDVDGQRRPVAPADADDEAVGRRRNRHRHRADADGRHDAHRPRRARSTRRRSSTTPILGRKFEDLLTLTPGVSVVQGPDGDEITFAGQRGVFNNISLDGGDYNNGFFGEQVGGQRAAIDITLDAVKEFQVIATGANAEFGRTAGGVVNVITKSGTNQVQGSLFYFQRLEGLTVEHLRRQAADDFHREQFGGTVGGPIVKDKVFYFGALEGIRENLLRPNLSEAIGTPCPVSAPTLGGQRSADQRQPGLPARRAAQLLQSRRGQDEGQPVEHTVNNNALLGKIDWNLSAANNLSVSYNFNYSKNENQTFDVADLRHVGQRHRGAVEDQRAQRQPVHARVTREQAERVPHHVLARESRPRSATASNDSRRHRHRVRHLVPLRQPVLPGAERRRAGEALPGQGQLLDRQRRAHDQGRRRVAAHATTTRCSAASSRAATSSTASPGSCATPRRRRPAGSVRTRSAARTARYVTAPARCPAGTTTDGGPLLFYLQSSSPDGIARDAAGASDITNEEFSLFVQDKWQAGHGLTLDYGLRWDAQLMPETVDPKTTAFAPFLNDPRFPSDGTIPESDGSSSSRAAGSRGTSAQTGKTVVRGSAGIYYARQNMLSQVGSVTTNGIQQKSDFRDSSSRRSPTCRSGRTCCRRRAAPPGTFPLFTGIRVFDRDYQNPRIFSFNVGFERELVPSMAAYVDFTVREGRAPDAVPQLQRARHRGRRRPAGDARHDDLHRRQSVRAAAGRRVRDHQPRPRRSTAAPRSACASASRSSYQFEANYVLSKDEDDDSNERDPFTDRSFNFYDLSLDYGPSDRDIRHKVNFFTYAELPHRFLVNVRMQGRTAQPITTSPRVLNGVDRGRNWDRKDNAYFSFDWRLQRPFRSAALPR